MKRTLLIFLVLGLMWFMYYAGSYIGRHEGVNETKRTYLDSAMKSDSLRWAKWDCDQLNYDHKYDSLLNVMIEVTNDKN